MGNNSTTNKGIASRSRLGSWGSSIDEVLCGPDTICGDWDDTDERLPLFTNPPTRKGSTYSTLSAPEPGRRKPPSLKRSNSIGGASIRRPATTNYSDTSDPPDSAEDFPVARRKPSYRRQMSSPGRSEFDPDFVPAPVTTAYSSRPPPTRRMSEMPQPVFDNHKRSRAYSRRASEPLSLPGYLSELETPPRRSVSPPKTSNLQKFRSTLENRPAWQNVYVPPPPPPPEPRAPLKPIRKQPSKEYKTNHKVPLAHKNNGSMNNYQNNAPMNNYPRENYTVPRPSPPPIVSYSPIKVEPILQPPPVVRKEKRIVKPKGKTKQEAPKPFIVPGKPPPPKEKFLVSPLENEPP